MTLQQKPPMPLPQATDGVSIFTTRLDEALAWGRKFSLWPMPMGISCCAIEMMAMVAPKFDLARFGAEALRFSPRQSDLMLVAGTVTHKMAPVVRRIYDQMPEPKWVIAMGACLCTGGMFDNWNVVQGLDEIIPVDVYVPGCPPRPEAVIDAMIKVQRLVESERHSARKKRIAAYQPKKVFPPVQTPDLRTHADRMVVNMGPQHPSTHGVLRMIAELEGETVKQLRGDVGFLHRSIEKMGESLNWNQFVPYTDKLDYLAPMMMNVGYMLAVEKLFDIEAPRRAQYLRTIASELSRISSHLLSFGTYALDVGAATIFFYTFELREDIYYLLERMSGARMNVAYTRVGGVSKDIDAHFATELKAMCDKLEPLIYEWEDLLSLNKIWINRTRNVGVLSKDDAIAFGITGPILRASGVPFDLRRAQPYLVYDEFDFKIPVGNNGDSYDRYAVRMEEMKESIKILRQAIDGLPEGPIKHDRPGISLPDKWEAYTSMEELIYQFKISSDGPQAPPGSVYLGTESSKGELGFYVVSKGGGFPYRVRIKSPSFTNLQLIEHMLPGCMIQDVVTTVASLDPVMGECDR